MKMKRNVKIIVIISVILAVIMVAYIYYGQKSLVIENYGFTDEQIEAYGPFWITVPAAENEGLLANINGIQFDDDPSNIFLIFPNDVQTDKIVYYIRDGYESQYEARRVGDFEKDGFVQIAGKTIWMIKTDLPILYIETDEEKTPFNDFKYTEDMEQLCYGKLFNKDLQPGTSVTLKPRGNVTWAGPQKKPYSVYIEERADLCGLGNVKSWNLLADYYDPSLMRNYIINKLSHNIGIEYEPEMSHVVLFINRQYEGVYLLSTKIKVDRELVNIGANDWLMCWGGTGPEQVIPYESKSWFSDTSLDYPYVDLLYPENDSEEGLKAKQEILQKYMDAIEDENSSDFVNYLDLESMAKCYWMQEFSLNVDAAFRSTYSFWDSKNGKMHFAPVWDFDYSLGTTGEKPRYDDVWIKFDNPETWCVRELAYFHELFKHPEFVEVVKDVYFREGGVRDAIYEGVELYESERDRIAPMARIDYKKYGNLPRELELFPDTASYDEYSEKVLDFYKKRLEWVDKQMSAE